MMHGERLVVGLIIFAPLVLFFTVVLLAMSNPLFVLSVAAIFVIPYILGTLFDFLVE